jgi:DNA invertase Pin-like site-specific DNA recombinase
LGKTVKTAKSLIGVRRGWEVAGEYVDLGVSGSKESCPELNRMLKAAHARDFDAVVV